jgi:septum formation protein
MIGIKLINKKIILASKSPRRRELLKEIGLPFQIREQEVAENYPPQVDVFSVARFLAKKKADSFILEEDELLITADTTVILEDEIFCKPKNTKEATFMLNALSGKTHSVCTGVCLKSQKKKIDFSVTTLVNFRKLTSEEIDYYVSNFKPYDKAGSYGIQEWIGYIGVKEISGCYHNVVGLPVSRLYQELLLF